MHSPRCKDVNYIWWSLCLRQAIQWPDASEQICRYPRACSTHWAFQEISYSIFILFSGIFRFNPLCLNSGNPVGLFINASPGGSAIVQHMASFQAQHNSRPFTVIHLLLKKTVDWKMYLDSFPGLTNFKSLRSHLGLSSSLLLHIVWQASCCNHWPSNGSMEDWRFSLGATALREAWV